MGEQSQLIKYEDIHSYPIAISEDIRHNKNIDVPRLWVRLLKHSDYIGSLLLQTNPNLSLFLHLSFHRDKLPCITGVTLSLSIDLGSTFFSLLYTYVCWGKLQIWSFVCTDELRHPIYLFTLICPTHMIHTVHKAIYVGLKGHATNFSLPFSLWTQYFVALGGTF